MSSRTTSARRLVLRLALVLITLATVAALPACSSAKPGSGPTTPSGPAAPDFTLRSLEGDNVRLSDYFGDKVVLLDFWSTTCDPCLQEMPELVALYDKYKSQGFIVFAISTDEPETMAQVTRVVRDRKMTFPVLLDEESAVMDRYNPKGELPFTVLIDRSGSIVLKRAAYQPGDKESMKSLVTAVEKALAAK